MKPVESQRITMGYSGSVQKWKTWTSIPGWVAQCDYLAVPTTCGMARNNHLQQRPACRGNTGNLQGSLRVLLLPIILAPMRNQQSSSL